MTVKDEHHPPLVAHIIYALGTGGLENGLVNIINRAPGDRYRHAIICLTDAGDFSRRIMKPDIIIIQLHKRPGHDVGLYWRLWRVLKDLRPAIVHTRNLAALEMQYITLLLPGIKRVHGEHGRDVHDLKGMSKKYNLLRKTIRPFIHRYITVSRDLQLWLNKTVGVTAEKINQIYNGIDQEKFSPRKTTRPDLSPQGYLPHSPFVLGTVGRLAEVKDQAILLQALRKLVIQQPVLCDKLRLIIVGDGPLRHALQKMIEDLDLSNLVWMAGDRDEVPELLRMMDLFILPSLAEGISNTILEAMATGLPIIATDVGGNPELVVEGINGTLIPVGNSEALATAIVELIEHPRRLISMGKNSLQKVKAGFSWDRTVDAYLSVYDELLNVTEQRQLPAN